jgi:enoyl-CoA hydratase/carnithine racemase
MANETTGDAVLWEQSGRVVTLTLNRPQGRNALDEDVVDALVKACARAHDDLSVSCIVLTGNGPAFCAGGNVKAMYAREGMFGGSPAEMRRAYRRDIQRIPLAFQALDVPVVAAVNGPAIGAGCDLAMMCDIRLGCDKTVFAESFVKLGLISGDGGAWLLPRVVGTSRAYEMTLTAEPVGSERALQWGIVSALHPSDRLLAEARALASRIAAHPPHSVRLNKRLLRESERMTLGQSLELAAGMQAIAQHTADQREAVAAYVEKREPRYDAK